jgi:hypothetical protein
MFVRRMSGGHSNTSMLAGAVVVALLSVSCREATPARAPETPKPELFLLTALPLVWSEDFGLNQPGSPALKALEQVYRVTAIDLPSQLPDGALLLAAQPRALPAEELVELDSWVRAGGRLLLLADPMLEWKSNIPLGDTRRPPMAFADTGLLERWGLRLDAPEERGARDGAVSERSVLTASPGALVATGDGCNVRDAGLTARCRLGKGEAIIIADADFLNVGSDKRGEQNLAVLASQLASLTR